MMYVRTCPFVTLRNVANQRSYVIIIARKEGGAWERIIIRRRLWIGARAI